MALIMKVSCLPIGQKCCNDVEKLQRSLTEAAKEARTSLWTARDEKEEENFILRGEFHGGGIAVYK